MPRVSAWLEAHIPETLPPFSFELVAGGRSNMTFRVVDGAERRMVLRRPPLGPTLPSAHDVAREHRIMSALVTSCVPVPVPLALCSDPTVNEQPFYVMEFVDGIIVRDEADAERDLPEHLRCAASEALIDVLGDLHELDPDEVGLGKLGRRNHYLGRQLSRWHSQWRASSAAPVAAVEEAHRLLLRHMPNQRRHAIVHGDFRIDNIMLRRDATVAAVLDWELCTIGDPLADIGLLMVYWVQAGESAAHLPTGTPTALPGFPTRQRLIGRYAARTGIDPDEITYYIAFGAWKLACIVAGIHARDRSTSLDPDGDPALIHLRDSVPDLAERAVDLLRAA